MPEKYFATIMKELPIGESDSIFIADTIIAGDLDEETKVLTSTTGQEYKSIIGKEQDDSINGYYYNLIEADKVTTLFKAGVNFSEAVAQYEERAKEIIYYITKNADGSYIVRPIDRRKTQELVETINATPENNQAEPNVEGDEEQDYDEDDEDQIIKYIKDLVRDVIDGEYDAEELKQIKEVLIDEREEIDAAIESIDLHIPTPIPVPKGIKAEQKAHVPTPVPLSSHTPKVDLINAKDVFSKVTKTLIAQDESAKRAIAEIARVAAMRKKEHAILLTGNPGVGKSLLVRLIALYVNRPVKIIDSTQLTSPAFQGRNIEQYLWELYEECGRNKQEAERAIIFFDEIDKKGSEKKSDPAGQAVLNTLLKFIEGTDYVASRNPQQQKDETTVKISTDNMIKILGGAFADVYKSRKDITIGGFGSTEDKEKEPQLSDFVKYGMMTEEFLGRAPVIIRLGDLNVEKLRDILLHSEESALKLQEEVFEHYGTKLTTKDGYILAVATKALEQQMGARGLNKIIFDSTAGAFADVCFNPGEYSEAILSEETVENPKSYQLIKKQ